MHFSKSIFIFLILAVPTWGLFGQEPAGEGTGGQSRESAAVDATASQWSFQLAYQGFNNYKSDTMRDGNARPEGEKNFIQFRLVAPINKGKFLPINLLPRLTVRVLENSKGKWGLGQSDLFILGILKDWGTGRFGVGPQVNFPAQALNDPVNDGSSFGSTKWGGGFATAVTQRALSDRLFLALLLQQTWTNGKASPLGINPVIVYQLGKGWYVGNGDFVISYNWQNGGWLVPFGVRLGKAFIQPKTTWNTYLEFQTPLAHKSWIGNVPSYFVRFNFQFQIPVVGGGK